MRKVIYFAVALVVLAAGAVLALPLLVSTDTVRDKVIAAVKDNTGRELTIGGDVEFSIFPNVHVTANKVALSNPKGFGNTPFAAMDRMDVKVKLMPLLSGTVAIQGFKLVKPDINLIVDKSGRNNWDFGAPGKAGAPKSEKAQGSTDLSGVEIGLFNISDGRLTYTDAQKGTVTKVENINVAVDTPNLASKMKLDGSLALDGDKITLAGELTTLNALINGQPAKLSAKISGGKYTADIAGDFTKHADTIEIKNAKISYDDIKATGTATVKLIEPRPYIAANLKLGKLDLTKFQNSGTKSNGNKAKNKKGWSREKIDFSGLKALDADLKLAASSVRIDKIKTGATNITTKLRNGVLTVNIPSLALYDGTINLALSVDTRKPNPALKSIGEIKNVNALPFLTDAADIKKIEGRTNVSFNVTSSGASEHAIMSALNGTAKLNFQKGALLGINIGNILRSVQRGKTQGFAKGGKTKFGTIVADYTFRNGVGTNKNLKMSGGEVRITGGGRVTMPKQTLNYKVNPSLVGRGGIQAMGINVPIIIAGAWSNPNIYPDLPGILDTPGVALKGLQVIGEGGVKGVTGIVDQVIPIGPNSGKSPLGKALKQPFKKLF